eukprot:PhM_4_TR17448/c2_g1_i2/m.88782
MPATAAQCQSLTSLAPSKLPSSTAKKAAASWPPVTSNAANWSWLLVPFLLQKKSKSMVIVRYGTATLQHHMIEMCQQLKAKTALPGGGALLRDLSVLCDKKETTEHQVYDIDAHENKSFKAQPFRVPDTSFGFDLGRTIDVIAQNAFGLIGETAALFLWPSLMNHSDSANTFRRNIGDFVWFWACADIK